jgi:hypothetical protein
VIKPTAEQIAKVEQLAAAMQAKGDETFDRLFPVDEHRAGIEAMNAGWREAADAWGWLSVVRDYGEARYRI